MARRRAKARLAIKAEENVSAKLKAERIALRGPTVVKALHAGASILAAAAAAAAPEDSGQLRRGVYVASMVRNEYAPLVRLRNGQRINSPLRFPPRPNQALVVNSVFYTRWVEGGRTPRTRDDSRARAHERRAVGLQGGRKRGRPFFLRAIRRNRATAQAEVNRRLVLLIETTWAR